MIQLSPMKARWHGESIPYQSPQQIYDYGQQQTLRAAGLTAGLFDNEEQSLATQNGVIIQLTAKNHNALLEMNHRLQRIEQKLERLI